MELQERIIDYLTRHPGGKAREIADALGEDLPAVTSCLYRLRGRLVQKAPDFRWRLIEGGDQQRTPPREEAACSTPLERLARYYLACLAKDVDRDVSEFAASKFGALNYAEVPTLPFLADDGADVWMSEGARRVLARIQQERRKVSLVLGYPTRLAFIRARSGWEGFRVEPILLFEFDVNNAGTPILQDHRPEINARALRALSGATGPEILDEILLLREELGLESERFSLDDIEDMIVALQQARPHWPWLETPDPTRLSSTPPLASASQEGIYNRAILLTAERAVYTQGLQAELRDLEQCPEEWYAGTALGHWLGNEPHTGTPDDDQQLIEVLPLNSEQRAAVRSCLTRPLTVITGPPGTGKSQVVASIIINCAWRGQRVLFASKNHKAVEVVEARVNALGARPVLLRLGPSEFQTRLAEHFASLLASPTLAHDAKEYEEHDARYRATVAARNDIARRLDGLIELRNRTDRLEQEVEALRGLFPGSLWNRLRTLNTRELRARLDAARVPTTAAIRGRQGYLARLFWRLIWRARLEAAEAACRAVHELAAQVGQPPMPAVGDARDAGALQAYLESVEMRIAAAEKVREYHRSLTRLIEATSFEELTRSLVANEEELTRTSAALWDSWLRLQPSRLTRSQRSLLADYKALLETMVQTREANARASGHVYRRFYELFPKLTHVYSAWAVTNLSVRGRVPLEPGFFDVLVVGEASQCDIASALPLLFRCKRAAIIGDPRQLRHISHLSTRINHQLMQEHGVSLLGERWSYTDNSLFDLAASLTESGDIISLRDHHRSRHEIIEFSNRHFYEGRLRVATRESQLRVPEGSPAIRWVDVVGSVVRPPGGGAVNESEARAVVRELERLVVEQRYDGTVGIISPFRAQANLIRDLVNEKEQLAAYLGRSELMIETVHRFQGDERDVMLFSPVLSRNTPRSAEGFLVANPNTFNVAITRARAALVVVGDHRACASSRVDHLAAFARYVEDARHRQRLEHPAVTDLGPEYPAVPHPDRVSEWERILYRALHCNGIPCLPQYTVEKYVLDLAVVIGDARLDIEVDGEMYHRSWDGELALRDQIRNRRLIELGWDVMRFWVYQVRDDLAGCVARVRRWVDDRSKGAGDAARQSGKALRIVLTSAEPDRGNS